MADGEDLNGSSQGEVENSLVDPLMLLALADLHMEQGPRAAKCHLG